MLSMMYLGLIHIFALFGAGWLYMGYRAMKSTGWDKSNLFNYPRLQWLLATKAEYFAQALPWLGKDESEVVDI